MMVRSDGWTIVTFEDFAFEKTAALSVDKAALEVRGVWYRLGEARIELAFDRRRIRGNGRYASGTLEIEVRALAPLRSQTTSLVVQGEGSPQTVSLDLVGAPSVLAQRIVCKVGDISSEGPRSVDVALSIPNDGVADCRAGSLRITPLTDGIVIESVRRELRLSLAYDRQILGAVLVPFEAAVGETAEYVVTVVVEPGVTLMNVGVDVYGGELLCHFESGNVSLSERHTTFIVEGDVTSPVVPMRAGMIATIEHRGGPIEDARLEVRGLRIVPTMIALGRLLPDEIRRFPFEVRLEEAGSTVQADVANVALVGTGGVIAIAEGHVVCTAPDSLAAKVQYGAMGNRGDVDVFVTVANTGFGPSAGLSLMLSTPSDVCFVADSLLIDDVPGAGVDGRWNADSAISLPTIIAGGRIEVRFTVRSAEAQRAPFEVLVRDEAASTRVRMDVAIEIPSYRGGSTVAEKAPSSIESPAPEQTPLAAEEPPAVAAAHNAEVPTPTEPQPRAEDEATGPDVPPVAAEASGKGDAHEPALVASNNEPAEEDVDLSAEALEFYGDGNVALGRHVLVVLSRAPEALQDATAALLRQYLPGMRAGAFAMSGHAYDSAALRTALGAVMEGAGESLAPDAPATFVLARAMALCTLPGRRSEPFKQYRDEVIVAVLKAKTDDDFDSELVDRDLMGVAA